LKKKNTSKAVRQNETGQSSFFHVQEVLLEFHAEKELLNLL